MNGRERAGDATPARRALERLLRLGEQAQARGGTKPVQMPMTETKCPEYCALQSLQAFERFEAEIALAVQCGAIEAEPATFGRDDRRLTRLRLLDAERLGAHLGLRVLSAKLRDAEAVLMNGHADFPVLEAVLARWRSGRRVRDRGPEAVGDLVDAMKAVSARRVDPAQERLLRRESVRIFGDSKRLEALTPWLDLLLTGEVAASGLEPEQVWSALGLRREPQPVLIAGSGAVRVGDVRLPLCRPYLGLPIDALCGLDTSSRYLMTIENLTSFHDAARALPEGDGLLVYSGGMPSPPWRALYARLIRWLPADARLYHWGDIDEGGFRIAAAIASIATEAGRTLQPWRMAPEDVLGSCAPVSDGVLIDRIPVDSDVIDRMATWAGRAGWHRIAEALRHDPVRIEQEALDPSFPDRDS